MEYIETMIYSMLEVSRSKAHGLLNVEEFPGVKHMVYSMLEEFPGVKHMVY